MTTKIDRIISIADMCGKYGWDSEPEAVVKLYDEIVTAAASDQPEDYTAHDPALVRSAVARYYAAIAAYGKAYNNYHYEFAKAFNASVKKTIGEKSNEADVKTYHELPPLLAAEGELLSASVDYYFYTGKSPVLPQEIGKFR